VTLVTLHPIIPVTPTRVWRTNQSVTSVTGEDCCRAAVGPAADAGCGAVAEAKSFDEVKDIRRGSERRLGSMVEGDLEKSDRLGIRFPIWRPFPT
jgi:hypothetical protein